MMVINNMNFETEFEIQVSIARWFDYHKCIIVPNLSWSMFPFELDLAVLKPSGYLTEVEIKVSIYDLKRDGEKHRHKAFLGLDRIREKFFAIPEKLKDAIEFIPAEAGVLVVSQEGWNSQIRKAKINRIARKLSDTEKFNLARLNNIRYWRLEMQKIHTIEK